MKTQQFKNKFEESFFKLMNSSAYGSPLERKRNRVNVKFFRKHEDGLSETDDTLFNSLQFFDQNLASISC